MELGFSGLLIASHAAKTKSKTVNTRRATENVTFSNLWVRVEECPRPHPISNTYTMLLVLICPTFPCILQDMSQLVLVSWVLRCDSSMQCIPQKLCPPEQKREASKDGRGTQHHARAVPS